MATVFLPNIFIANTPALASEVNANFNAILAQVNGNLTTANLADGAVTSSRIANNAITTQKIAPLSVESPRIGNMAVTTEKINQSAVTNEKIADGAVTSGKIANGAVTAAKFASASISPANTSFLHTNIERIFSGFVSGSTGAQSKLPSGWSVVATVGAGGWRVIHNLGLTDLHRYSIQCTFQNVDPTAVLEHRTVSVYPEQNEFLAYFRSVGGVDLREDFSFTLTVLTA